MFRSAGVVRREMLVKSRCVRHAGSEALTCWHHFAFLEQCTHLQHRPHPRQHWQPASPRRTRGTSGNTSLYRSSRSKSTRRSKALPINHPPFPSPRWRNAQAYTHYLHERMTRRRRGVPGTSRASSGKTKVHRVGSLQPSCHILSFYCHYFMPSILSQDLPLQSSD